MARVNDLLDQVASLTAQLQAAYARIAHLLSIATINPREITRTAFRARLFAYVDKGLLFDLIGDNNTTEIRRVSASLRSQNPNVAVQLDSVPIGNLLDDFVTLELLTAQQVIDIKRDATTQEAFV